MTTTKTNKGEQVSEHLLDENVLTCVVTGWPRLAEKLRAELGEHPMKVKHMLADLIGEKDCRVIVVDTKVNDIDIWPAPLLLEPSARAKSWVFLLSQPQDARFLTSPPPDCAFFLRRFEALEKVATYVHERFAPDSGRRISRVEYIKSERTFIVRMENGRAYALKLDDLPEADSSDVARWSLSRDRYFFRVVQASGTRLEVPWDDVLYHCEPEYEYFKGRQKELHDFDRAVRIGHRVRELRVARGLSITELAERAGLKRPNLSRLEYGRHIPSLETLERVAEALGVPVAQLIAIDRNRPVNASTD